MPLGVESRQRKEYQYSYYELRDVTTKNIDEHIVYAQKVVSNPLSSIMLISPKLADIMNGEKNIRME